jgi:carbon storage regulator
MLVLSRKANEKIYIGDDIIIQVAEIGRGEVKIGITAPKDVKIVREEIRRVFGTTHPVHRNERQTDAMVFNHRQMGLEKGKRGAGM